MRGSANVAKGRVEEAAGALTGNNKLRARGRKNQTVGRVKQTGEKGVRQAKKSSSQIVKKAKNVARAEAAKAKSRR